jgi:uncharacterized C2H2 Zn-finger protein
MKNKPGPKIQEVYTCRCCNKIFQTSKQRSTHESKKRLIRSGPDKKRFKVSESVATPSMNGEELDERMNDTEFVKPVPFRKSVT